MVQSGSGFRLLAVPDNASPPAEAAASWSGPRCGWPRRSSAARPPWRLNRVTQLPDTVARWSGEGEKALQQPVPRHADSEQWRLQSARQPCCEGAIKSIASRKQQERKPTKRLSRSRGKAAAIWGASCGSGWQTSPRSTCRSASGLLQSASAVHGRPWCWPGRKVDASPLVQYHPSGSFLARCLAATSHSTSVGGAGRSGTRRPPPPEAHCGAWPVAARHAHCAG